MSGELVDSLFPGMGWTGRSVIHRSIAREYIIDPEARAFFETAPVGVVMRVLARANFHKLLSDTVQAFPLGEVEWLMSQEDFWKLSYYLTYRSLTGNKPGLKGKRIQNPSTGNVFIPLLIKGKVIAGIRIWAGHSEGAGMWRLGFRIRFVSTTASEEKNERQRAKDTLKEMQELTSSVQELTEIKDYIEVAEPITDTEKGLRVRIRLPQHQGGPADDAPEVAEPDWGDDD